MNRLERAQYLTKLARDNNLNNKCIKDLESLVSDPEPGLLTWNSFLCQSGREVELFLIESEVLDKRESWI